ncbi:helicase [Dietzia sp. UCD-THP]|uniref:DEAD/DEAH box helicase n=1 Tax=Dietzia sp. UCD-THP TaxID=1292020 RepID=UPI000437B9EF|nr:DEAD/DEAH box helicase [Dietzia sp. UCD-THP]EYT60945.1 helicase [Dietzia sp. UCD-THP]
MSSFAQVIDAFRQAPNTVEMGTKFEQLMVRYFELDPTLSREYDAVWQWMDWPDRDGKPDNGIDLVARVRDTGEYAAIQCKFYAPDHTLTKANIDSFFTESGKAPFTRRIIISTTNKWGKNALAALEGQTVSVQRIGTEHLEAAPIDWDIAWPKGELSIDLSPSTPHELRPHQQTAVDKVFTGFDEGNDRGKLVMACGTGKTFTALKIAERTAADNGGRARILFAVPSISLLSQTLREWSAQCQLDMRSFAVCSDNKVSRAAEDYATEDVAIPVTTNPAVLAERMGKGKRAAGLTVVFTTYQSLPSVAAAQSEHGVDPFDLVICDEAHRTTGVTLAGDDPSNFTRVHDADFLRAHRRLYMTATPRLFDDTTKAKAEDHSAEISSMDDLEIFGPEFHRLGFGEAVDKGLLTDYKVLVLTVDESVMAPRMQDQFAVDGELSLDDASKIVGCWNGLAKRAGATASGESFPPGAQPMKRAVAFAKDIASSKQIEAMFPAVVGAYQDLLDDAEDDGREILETNRNLSCQVHHVDGTYNAMRRNEELSWLKAPVADDECRILTNARCLSEGVDVPALDAVLFLHPRNSVVDVVQSVGRVMRKSAGKDYGYIILPVAVPADTPPSQALADNKRFKTVWQVLNALRAHDERFNAMVNSIALNTSNADKELGKGTSQLLAGNISAATDHVDGHETAETAKKDDKASATQMALFSLSEWQEAIYTRIVDKVGTRTYWEDWASDVSDISARLIARINAILDAADPALTHRFEDFVQGLKDNLNDSIGRDDAVSMLAQHLITKPVFDALFEGHDFAAHNPVSRVMQTMVDALSGSGLDSETNSLEKFYASVRVRASEVSSAEGKQQVIAELYERFFKLGFAKQADALGIVYTPVQIVDFILRAADHASREAFGRGLTDEGVHILDGFTGTGTFVTRLLQSGLIHPDDLARKYASELHANELMLLAYYIAAVNIETTYHALTGASIDDYEPFPGIVLADTFQISEADDGLDLNVFPANNDRITRQLDTPINVIVGNPPYSVGQGSANDLNANLGYPTLDSRITDTYAKLSTGSNKNSLYDSYLRAFRWATDRIGNQGIVAFVANGGWIENNTSDGIRLSLVEDYDRIYVYNLRGNMRKSNWKEEGGQIFGGGSQTTIAIWIGVKDPSHIGDCEILYRSIGDYLSRDDKLATIDTATLENLDWQSIAPNSHGDWIGQRDDVYGAWPVLGTKKAGDTTVRYFHTYSAGLQTNRDPWVYSYSRLRLEDQVRTLIDNYNRAAVDFATYKGQQGLTKANEKTVNTFLAAHPEHADEKTIKWSSSLKSRAARGERAQFNHDRIVEAVYRPFSRQHAYFDAMFNHRRGELASMFPTPHHHNMGFYVVGAGSDKPFSLLMSDRIVDLALWGSSSGQFFPRWTYVPAGSSDGGFDLGEQGSVDEFGYRRVDNITDDIAAVYSEALDGPVNKDDIFYSVYAQLHDPGYRTHYAADLKKMLPHLPPPYSRGRFNQLANWGRQLANLHAGYENVEPWPLDVTVKPGVDDCDRTTWRVEKLKFKSKTDHTTIIYNRHVTISGIPDDAERYLLGSRTALAWLIDRYQVKTDKASGIVNDPNDWADEHDDHLYIVNLIAKVTRVAVETMEIVDQIVADSDYETDTAL